MISKPTNLKVPPKETKGDFIENPGPQIKFAVNRANYLLINIPCYLQKNSWYLQGDNDKWKI